MPYPKNHPCPQTETELVCLNSNKNSSDAHQDAVQETDEKQRSNKNCRDFLMLLCQCMCQLPCKLRPLLNSTTPTHNEEVSVINNIEGIACDPRKTQRDRKEKARRESVLQQERKRFLAGFNGFLQDQIRRESEMPNESSYNPPIP